MATRTGCERDLAEGASLCKECGQRRETGTALKEAEAPPDTVTFKYQYKTITLAQKGLGWFSSRRVREVEGVLNREASLG